MRAVSVAIRALQTVAIVGIAILVITFIAALVGNTDRLNLRFDCLNEYRRVPFRGPLRQQIGKSRQMDANAGKDWKTLIRCDLES